MGTTTNAAVNIRPSRKGAVLFKLICRRLGMSYGEGLEMLSCYYYQNELSDHKKHLSMIEQELKEIDDAAAELMQEEAA